MTLLQLRYFVALAKKLHYTKTAEELHISQPSLSYAIAEMEKELGTELFNKKNKKIELNQNGKLFLNHAERALQILDEGTRMLKAANKELTATVNLGYFYSALPPIQNLINDFTMDRKDIYVMFHFEMGQDAVLIEKLKRGDLDLAFCLSQDQALESIPVWEQQLYLFVPQSHRLAQRQTVCFKDFCDELLVALKKESQLRRQIEAEYEKHRLKPRIIIEAEECNATLQHVGLGDGVAIMPQIPIMERTPVRAIPIDETGFCRTIYLSRAKERILYGTAAIIRDYIMEKYEENGGKSFV